jgi:mRNA-degrading endonuclease toxin of MazEF toxin-antitoxin module
MSCPARPTNPTHASDEHLYKGCIYWFDVANNADPAVSMKKARPYIIISKFKPKAARIIVSPITDREHCVERDTDQLKYPYNAPLNKCDYNFLDKDCVALLDQAYTIDKGEFCEEWYMGKIEDLSEVDKAVMYNYDLFKSIEDAFSELIKEYSVKYKSQYSRK